MNNRIEYIDAMRGLAMIMVVIGHFFVFSFHYHNALFLNINAALELPIFFMISGFFAPHILNNTSVIFGEFVNGSEEPSV